MYTVAKDAPLHMKLRCALLNFINSPSITTPEKGSTKFELGNQSRVQPQEVQVVYNEKNLYSKHNTGGANINKVEKIADFKFKVFTGSETTLADESTNLIICVEVKVCDLAVDIDDVSEPRCLRFRL